MSELLLFFLTYLLKFDADTVKKKKKKKMQY